MSPAGLPHQPLPPGTRPGAQAHGAKATRADDLE
jgi:hypothetical protein